MKILLVGSVSALLLGGLPWYQWPFAIVVILALCFWKL